MDRLHVDYNIGLGVDEVDGSRCPRSMTLGRSSTSRGGSRNMKRVVLLHADIFCHAHIYLTTPT